MALHHLALGARNVVELAAFYREAFTLEVVTEHRNDDGRVRSIWLRLADASVLMIEETTATGPHVEGVGAGPFLLAFSVSKEAHEAKAKALTKLGAPVEDQTEMTTYHRDPEGNRVALSHYPLPTRSAPTATHES